MVLKIGGNVKMMSPLLFYTFKEISGIKNTLLPKK